MSQQFKDKTVMITGASSGIGAEAARLFAKEGARLLLIARRNDLLLDLAKELKEAYNSEIQILTLDVSNYDEVAKKLNTLTGPYETPDILINNAGLVRGRKKSWEVSPEEWNEMIDTNVKGILNISREMIPRLIKKNRGHIINIGSVAGHETYPCGNVYCATKYAVRALTDSLRMELIDSPIRVSMISPGMVNTEFSLVRFYGDQAKADKVYDGMDPLLAKDIAEALVFMASRPPHVTIADLIIYPTSQASTTIMHRRT